MEPVTTAAAAPTFRHLTEQCGHHCGALGGPDHGHVLHVGHCACADCHGAPVIPVRSSFTPPFAGALKL